jgi:hypothetical protein
VVDITIRALVDRASSRRVPAEGERDEADDEEGGEDQGRLDGYGFNHPFSLSFAQDRRPGSWGRHQGAATEIVRTNC